jgi:type I restriction enzyme M protein
MALNLRTNETLKNDMWRACDILRRDNNVGGVLAYTEHIAWLLFLKFLDEEEKKRQELAAFEGKSYEPVLQGDLAWDAWASPAKLKSWKADELIQFVRGRLLPGLATLPGSGLSRTIARIFSDESTGDQNVVRNVPVCASGYNLKDVIEIINSIHFEREDDIFTITNFYEDLLLRMGSESGTGGEFHTPRPVIRFMVEVIDPQIGETVYDPAFGSAGFLAQAYLHMEPKAQTVQDREFLQQHAFYGQEKKGIATLLGTMNLVLHGVSAPDHVTRANTLEESMKGSVSQRHDIILTNPPFGGTEGRHIQENFPVRSNATELLFLQHILKKLKQTPNARCAMVVPEGTLFRGGAFADVKKELLEAFHLFAVVSLPPGTFSPYSDVKTALLFFKRPDEVLERNPQAREETWYYELPLPEGLKKFSKGSPILDEHFAEARGMWRQWKRYLDGEGERPFEYAAELRARWQVYFAWEAYRAALEKGETAEAPHPSPDDDPATRAAHAAQGPKPPEPYTSWLERREDLVKRNYDLSARNPNQDDRITLPHPAEITARLLERTRELQSILENLHSLVSNGDSQNAD